MNVDQQAVLNRIKRKAEILKMDLKSSGDTKHHDVNEILLLIDLLEHQG
jgi:hypothetical protein